MMTITLNTQTSPNKDQKLERRIDAHANSIRRSGPVLAEIAARFSLDGDTILKDGRPAPVTMHDKGYRLVQIGTFNGKVVRWRYARLLFFLKTGEMPAVVNHENGIRDDDRFDNLRPATNSENARNSKRHTDKTSGLPRSVEYHPGLRKPYRVRMTVDGKRHTFGYYATAEEAETVAREKHREIAGGFHSGVRYRRKPEKQGQTRRG